MTEKLIEKDGWQLMAFQDKFILHLSREEDVDIGDFESVQIELDANQAAKLITES